MTNRMTRVSFVATLASAWTTAQAVTYEFDEVAGWGGISHISISQAAYLNGAGTEADIIDWEVFSLLFNNLDGAGLNGSFKSTDPGVAALASFTLTPDKANLVLNFEAQFSDARYLFSTWPQSGAWHNAQAFGFDASHNPPGSYWQHTTQGEWKRVQGVPEATPTLALLVLGAGLLWRVELKKASRG